ncbi:MULTISPECIES: TetR/AcrR family transcriptional regulator [Paraburkholderia]|uniref:HTH tetR-type domain-containing protein n=1 Tax=Paraburkholderia nemoris TaxID=2793076 RepID=A0ABM8SNH9_9BURK|nr:MULTISPECIES: TetR/AcrR family transcriptional regulator [Paraburkholderia]MBK5183264.1 TetR/AcrR family transcriptional regulator [Burkholderia sp. R-69749]MBK3814756.1 TetR/AcrR family transcriptional regulator [Paraburkholderia aspalathi]CAE6822502.1 hypothetical protein R69776_06213 [Paraburkholderia nemoris]CAE6835097.1 hypothetical protein R75777_06791 [Paraburkholderia nemoris]CAE6859302.1 hypothetical protein R69749_05348 [Paraburkholderia domus]
MLHKRQDIIETALRLFELHGYRAVGIDRIIAESGVAKMTMYKHFRSKDDLVVEVLRERDRRTRESLAAFVTRSKGARNRVQAIFQWLDRRLKCAEFNGCMFVNAVSEYGQDSGEILRAASEHKSSMQAYFTAILSESVSTEAEPLSRQLMMLIDGATVATQVSGRSDSAMAAWEIFSKLLPKSDEAAGKVAPRRVPKPAAARA